MSFTLSHNGRVRWHLPPQSREARAQQLLGEDFYQATLPIDEQAGGVGLSGLIAQPAYSRTTRDAQYVYVNGRFVRDRLLAHALKSLRKRGAKVAEGYPVNLKPGQRLPNAFAWTGTRPIFAKAGFELAGPGGSSKVRMRRKP